MTRDLLEKPLWRPDDLGRPIPDSPHAVSVCLPTWRDNVGYEEDDPRVHGKISTGYPRFVYNGLCRQLFAECSRRFAEDGETALAFPTQPTAERFADYLRRHAECDPALYAFGQHDVHAVCFSEQHAAVAKSGWQHCGEGISSRQAEAVLAGREYDAGSEAKQILRERVATLAGVSAGDVFLFPCGMNAIYRVHRALGRLFPERKSVQFGFPYVDSLKIQEKFGPGVRFLPRGDAGELAELQQILSREPVCGLYTEYPSNPLLVSPPLETLCDLARRHGFPLVVDETLATFVNADVLPVADVICTSLTKFFSGIGDVTAGSLIVNPESAFHDRLVAELADDDEDLVWGEDARVLERNSRDFVERMSRINQTAERLADHLHAHPLVARVEFPKYRTPDDYRSFLKPGGGWGGLLSVSLHDPAQGPQFFDALPVCKGPNLGTNYTLACPYTILAHYRELDFAESCGVSRFLVRVSVGLEEADDLIGRFDRALAEV